MAHKMTPDQLVAELVEHVAESVEAAQHGDYEAKQWLLWAFPGNVAQFRLVWQQQAPENIRIVSASSGAAHRRS